MIEYKIGQQLSIPLDLRELIPKDHPSYFIQNVVDEIDFLKVDLNYSYKADNPDYSREIKDEFTFDLEKTPISAQWGKYSKTKAIKTTHE